MMIDHYDFGIQRGFARGHHKTFLVVVAVAAQAVVATRYGVMPSGGVFGNAGSFGAIAAAAGFGKACNFGEPGRVITVGKAAVGQILLNMMVTHVIGTAFEQGDADR